MNEQASILSRIGKWFRRGPQPNGDMPPVELDVRTDIERVDTARSTFLRPWAKRDAAIASLQESFASLSDLMNGIRVSLEKQTQRQDELVGYLKDLPLVVQSLPESQRAQTQTLQAIVSQMEQQNSHQGKLTEALDKLGEAHAGQKQALDSLNERTEGLRSRDEAITDNLKSMGSALESVGRNSDSTTQVLQQVGDKLNQSSSEIEKILRRQDVRFTTLLAFAIFMAVGSLVAVCIFGYIVVSRGH